MAFYWLAGTAKSHLPKIGGDKFDFNVREYTKYTD